MRKRPMWSAGSRQAAGGFTLLELLLVVVLVAILAAVVSPTLQPLIRTIEVETAVRELGAALVRAQLAALSKQSEAVVEFDLPERKYRTAPATAWTQLPAALKLTLVTAEEEVVTDSRAGIRFYADGSATGGQLQMASPQGAYTIDIDWLTGRVATYDEDAHQSP